MSLIISQSPENIHLTNQYFNNTAQTGMCVCVCMCVGWEGVSVWGGVCVGVCVHS